jgi:hypothetical protein
MTQLQILANPSEFFRDQVTSAAATMKLRLDAEEEYYLVSLLTDFVSSPAQPENSEDSHPFDTPLALMLQKAMESTPDRRFRIFKKMGDTSLYVSGFFQDYFNRKMFSISYYMDMGKTAYSSAAGLMSDQFGDSHFGELYSGLAKKFDQFVELLATISDSSESGSSAVNILELYDRWNQTGSHRLRRELSKHGIEPLVVTRKSQ